MTTGTVEAAPLHQRRHEANSARVGRKSKQRRQVYVPTGAQHLHLLQELRLFLHALEVKLLDGQLCVTLCPTHAAQRHRKKHAAEAAPAEAVRVCTLAGGDCQLAEEENDH